MKALLLNPNVHNPLGSVMPDEKKRQIAEMTNRAKIPIIEDDTYGDLAFESPRPRCIKAFDTSGDVILCSSFSKTIAPGYRIGWVAAGRWHGRVNDFKCTSSLGTAIPPHGKQLLPPANRFAYWRNVGSRSQDMKKALPTRAAQWWRK